VGSAVSRPRVYLDSNVFIAAFEHVGAHSDHAWWILNAVQSGEIAGVTSEVTLAEVLVKPVQLGYAELASAYETMLVPGPNFEMLSVNRSILIKAAGIRARRTSVRLPDAVHMATAEALSCPIFVSEDRSLALPEGMRLLPVNPFTLADILEQRT
jgi:predicted nucleic acid-binding protein